MNKNDQHIEAEVSSEKSFGIVFAVIFFLIALYPLLYKGQLQLWALIVSIFLLIIAYRVPKLLAHPNRLWFRFGMALGGVIAPIVMGVIYFAIVYPIGLVMRLAGKDLLLQKMNPDAQSYWIDRKQPVGSMKDQF